MEETSLAGFSKQSGWWDMELQRATANLKGMIFHQLC
jgi:hypothetical protein